MTISAAIRRVRLVIVCAVPLGMAVPVQAQISSPGVSTASVSTAGNSGLAGAEGSAVLCLSAELGCPGVSMDGDNPSGKGPSGANASAQATDNQNSQDDWVHRWLETVDATRTAQPHYVAPLITTHVLLVQQFRFDSYYQEAPGGVWTSEYGAGKGLEIIPNSRTEVQVGVPPYYFHQARNTPDSFGDTSIFLKFRAFSAPEGKGDYFVGFFLGGSFPTGSLPNSMGHIVWSPMLAAAKGWGFFDYQTALSGNLPQSGTVVLGRQILYNNTFQFGIDKNLWPELETNTTFYVDGPHSGEQSTYLTPGLLIGPFAERLHVEPGFGVQIAATHFHLYDHRWIWTMRFPF
jgi:hypothetical protein